MPVPGIILPQALLQARALEEGLASLYACTPGIFLRLGYQRSPEQTVMSFDAARVCLYFLCSVINTMAACTVAVNAVSLGLLALSSLSWNGSFNENRVSTTVGVLELVAICGEEPSTCGFSGHAV